MMLATIAAVFSFIFATEACSALGLKRLVDRDGNIAHKRQSPYYLEDCEWKFPKIIKSDYSVLVMMYHDVYIRKTRNARGSWCSGEIWLDQEDTTDISYMYRGNKCGVISNACHVYYHKSSKCVPSDIMKKVNEMYPGCSLWWSTADNHIEALRFSSRFLAKMNFNVSYNILDCEPQQTTKEEMTTALETTSQGKSTLQATNGMNIPTDMTTVQTSMNKETTEVSIQRSTSDDKILHNRLKSSQRVLAIIVTILSFLLLVASAILVRMYLRQRKVISVKYPHDESESHIETGSFRLNPAYEETSPVVAEMVENIIYEDVSVEDSAYEDVYSVVQKPR